MTIAIEQHLEQLKAQDRQLGEDIAAATRTLEDAERQHHEILANAEKLTADVKAGKAVTAEALAAALRAVGESERSLAELRPATERKLRDLEHARERVQTKLAKAIRELNRAKFSDAAVKYEEILKVAIPLSREIRQLAHAASIALEQGAHDCLLDHMDVTEMTLGGRKLFQHRPW